MIRLDYETRSRLDLRKVGQWRYAQDESTEILCLAYRIKEGPVKSWQVGQKFPQDLNDAIESGMKICAFNANFERAISECCGAKIGMCIPLVTQWVDTQAIALMCGLPASLEVCAKVLKLDEQKDKEGSKLISFFCKPKKDGAFNSPKDNAEKFKSFVLYCKQDVRTEEAVFNALPIKTLGVDQKTWEMDSEINKRGIPMDLSLINGAIDIQKRALSEACVELSRITCKKVTSPGQTERIVDLAEKLGCDPKLPNVQADTIKAFLKMDIPPLLKKVLRIRQRTAQAAVKKYPAAKKALCSDNRIRSVHRYHGAHTGRWSASLLQTQNFARARGKYDEHDNELIRNSDYDSLEMLYKDPMAVLRDCVRHMIKAPKGKKLVVCDLASIEARVLGWLAEDPKYMKAFKEGLDLYIVTAAEIFGIDYSDVSEDQRWVGKQAVLALGYSMGVDTFYAQCVKSKPDISRGLLERAVKAYRKTYQKIVKYWSLIEAAAISAVARPGKVIPAGAVSLQMVSGYLTMILPCKRRLWYPEAKVIIQKTKWGEEKSCVSYKTCIKKRLWVSKTTYGGKLTENAVQAIARDVLVHGMLKMEEEKLPVVFHVHDEPIALVPPDRKVQEVVDCLTAVPHWCPGISLGAKGFETQFYRKG